jgi:predicted PurR-regulated permease PerM
MSLGIRHKLIIAFTAIALLVTVLAFVAMLLSFRSGFLQYLNDARFNSIEQLSQRITAEVETKKQWQALTQNPRQWQRFIRQSMNENTDGFVLPPPRH